MKVCAAKIAWIAHGLLFCDIGLIFLVGLWHGVLASCNFLCNQILQALNNVDLVKRI